MATFFVNGRSVTATKSQSLLRFLRDELRLTSVKDGCSEGACGACTVIIDGETCRACVPKTDQLEGRHIITVEGLSDWEKAMRFYHDNWHPNENGYAVYADAIWEKLEKLL